MLLLALFAELLLAQSADESISLLGKIIAGGPALIFAVTSALLGIFSYRQLQANNELEKSFREKIQQDADKHREGSEKLLREMLERDKEALEGTVAAVRAVENFTAALKLQQTSCEESNRLVASLADRIRALEDELRRSNG